MLVRASTRFRARSCALRKATIRFVAVSRLGARRGSLSSSSSENFSAAAAFRILSNPPREPYPPLPPPPPRILFAPLKNGQKLV